MAETKVKCVYYGSTKTVKFGKQSNSTLRYRCKQCSKIFQDKYIKNGDIIAYIFAKCQHGRL